MDFPSHNIFNRINYSKSTLIWENIMDNLIKNSCWAPGPNGGPQFFSGTMTTYDDLCIDGCRTCSICLAQGCNTKGCDRYDPLIDVCGKSSVTWGYIIRTIDADCIELAADFYDCSGALVGSGRCPITPCVTCQFTRQMRCFPVPCNAQTVRLCILFSGKITACTFYCPMAFYSC